MAAAATLKLPNVKPALPASGGSQVNDLLSGNKGTGSTTGQIMMAPFKAATPKAPKASATVVSKPGAAKPAAGKATSAAPVSATDKLANQIQTGTFGLNTGSTTAYNPFAAPTQGQVNQQILQQARAQYLPTLQTIQGGIGAENTASPQRVADIKSIYGAYGTEAQDAYNQLKSSLTDQMTANAAGNQAAQGVLGAALSSANVPGQDLNQMMGITGPAGSPASPYLAGAEARDQGLTNELQQIAAGTLGTSAEQISNAGLERAQQLDTESLRHQAALQGFQGQMQALAQQIPGDISTARNALITQLQNAATSRLQNQIAQQTLKLNQGAQAFSQKQQNLANQTTIANNAEKTKEFWAAYKQANYKIATDAQTTADKTNASNAFKVAQLQGKQQAAVSKTISSYLMPTKDEQSTYTSVTTDPNNPSNKTTSKGQKINEQQYYARMNPSDLLSAIESDGLNRQQALIAMTTVDTPHGNARGQTMGQWAKDQLYYAQAPGYTSQPQDVTSARQQELNTIAKQVIAQARQIGNQQWARDLQAGPGETTMATPQPANWYKNFLPAGWNAAYQQALKTLRTSPNWRLPSAPRATNQVWNG